MKEKSSSGVLVVDDEPALREILTTRFAAKGIACYEAGDTQTALQIIDQTPGIGVVLVDVQMPGKSGLDLIAEAKAGAGRDMEFIVMTGAGGMDEAIRSMHLGARDFLRKPMRFDQLDRAVRDGFSALAAKEARRRKRVELEKSIRRKSEVINSLVHEIDIARDETLETLVVAAQHRDDETGAHIRRMGAYVQDLALGIGLGKTAAKELGSAAMLHDIGKIGVPDDILMKPGALTENEYDTMRTHTIIGHQIMVRTESRMLKTAATIALHHHERWDGSGYPHGLAGDAIPFVARIAAVCDVYDALRSPRPYKPAIDHDRAVDMLINGDERTQPHQFDPEVMRVLWQRRSSLKEIYASFPEPAVPPADTE